jgi:hypothetical protein
VDRDKIQQANIEQVCLNGDYTTIYHVALCDIKANTPLGFSYGATYWIDQGVSPLLIEDSSFSILNLTRIFFSGLAALRDKETQSTRLHSLTNNPGGTLCGVSMIALLRFFCDKNNKELQASHFIMTLSLHVAIQWKALCTTLEESIIAIPDASKAAQPKSLITFFDSTPVFSCAPPPGFKIVDNRTILPGVV